MRKKDMQYFICVDIGTTTIRVCVYCEQKCKLIFSKAEKVELLCPKRDRAEIDPEKLWDQFVGLIKSAVEILPKSCRDTEHVTMGICCQRNSFITWNKETLEMCHPIITWKDSRAKDVCATWNSSISVKGLNIVGWLVYFITRSQRFKAAKIFKFLDAMVSHRFMVTLDENKTMRQLLDQGMLGFGCLDTWLINRLTNGRIIVTEPSNASSTGLFDPFLGNWGTSILRLIGFPIDVLPELVNTAQVIAVTEPEIFGFPIRIGACLGDSQAAAFGCGMYPLVGWKINDNTTFFVEGRCNNTAASIQFAQVMGLIDNVDTASDIAFGTPPEPGLCFISAFNGVQTPVDNDNACSAFIGFHPNTSKAQMLRAVLESIAFRVYQIWQGMKEGIPMGSTPLIRLCGGVSQNDFICQQIAHLMCVKVDRVCDSQFTGARGAALLCGITKGVWTIDTIEELIQIDSTFYPDKEMSDELVKRYDLWIRAQGRCLNFYN
ncbi:putative glycerol kinase 5 [Ditylenchus destructor]|uniref:Glycerol kinase 5 n=1 Tax=Ditylenchus destructor TaxID=166010 RepID=A0AAD4R8E4_9BILA|nr:putative glycerol kinase 5 [Ditylenchus destructor]